MGTPARFAAILAALAQQGSHDDYQEDGPLPAKKARIEGPQTFSFKALPRELRDMVYKYFIDTIHLGPLPASGLPKRLSLLLVDKQVHSELLSVMYSHGTLSHTSFVACNHGTRGIPSMASLVASAQKFEHLAVTHRIDRRGYERDRRRDYTGFAAIQHYIKQTCAGSISPQLVRRSARLRTESTKSTTERPRNALRSCNAHTHNAMRGKRTLVFNVGGMHRVFGFGPALANYHAKLVKTTRLALRHGWVLQFFSANDPEIVALSKVMRAARVDWEHVQFPTYLWMSWG